MADSRIAYGLAKKHGIDTTGMPPQQVWDALKEKGISLGTDREADKERIAKKYSEDNTDSRGKAFINIQLFQAKDYSHWQTKSMEKSLRSHKKTIALHEDKIKNPQKYVSDWENLPQNRREGLIRKWKHEVKTYTEDIRRITEELKKR